MGVVLALAMSLLGACRGDAQPRTPPVPEGRVISQPVQAAASARPVAWTQLAERGEFADLLERLHAEGPAGQGQTVQRLVGALEHHQQVAQQRRERRADGLDEAVDEATDHFEAGRLEDALVGLIEAHGLAEQPDDFLDQPLPRQVTAAAEQAAQQAEGDDDWVEASGLYRLLNLLYEDSGRFREAQTRASSHVRVLQLYVPDHLRELYRTRAERRRAQREAARLERLEQGGDDPEDQDAEPEAPLLEDDLDLEAWPTLLRGVRRTMLEQALQQAARRHVDNEGYTQLVQGALDGLLIFLDTGEVLEGEFPSLADEQRLDFFRNLILARRARLDQPGVMVDRDEALELVSEVIAANERTLELPESVLIYELSQGAVSQLDDFSAVIWPEALAQFNRNVQGRFFGVGIQISRRDGQLVVVTPLANTPAQRAGIKAGDVITEVDGRSTAGWVLDRAVREITGPEDTEVVLGIERPGEADVTQVPIVRQAIEIESIRGWEHGSGEDSGGWNYWVDRDAGIGYVRLSQFIPQSADDLDAAIAQLQSEGELRGLILDLRFNPGGLLSAAVEVADRFIASGPIVSTVDGFGNRTHSSSASRRDTYEAFPVVVLINQGSASASEIVAGALQDYDRGLIVGTTSFGKGSVQDLFPLAVPRRDDRGRLVRDAFGRIVRDTSAYLKLTTQYYMLPRGRIIHRQPDSLSWGIEPDMVVRMTDAEVADALEYRNEVDVLRDPDQPAEDDQAPPTAQQILADGMDPQLEAALLVLLTRQAARDVALAQGVEPEVAQP
jgi:carboxyl-terminal processing protease